MVKSGQIYSPQNYLMAVTGKCYMYDGENDIVFINNRLHENDMDYLWDYPMSEIEHIVQNDIDVVLVDCMVVNPEIDQFEHQYRWFEVPEDFKEEL